MRSKILISLMALLLYAGSLSAVEIKTSGVIFADFNYTLSDYNQNGSSPTASSFDVSRVYLNTKAVFTEKVSGFLQYEVNLITPGKIDTPSGTSNSVYLKQGWLELKDIYKDGSLQFGIIPTPWRSYEEAIWKHRFVSKILDDIDIGIPASDRGVRLVGKVPYAEYDVGVYNGEGTKNNDVDRNKDFQGRVSIMPVKDLKLKLNAYYQSGKYADGADQERDRFFSGLSYESKKFNAMANVYNTSQKGVKGVGYSAHGVFHLTDKNWLFARYDNWDFDKNVSGNAKSRVYFGYGREITPGVRGTIDYQAVTQQQEAATRKDQQAVFMHCEVKF